MPVPTASIIYYEPKNEDCYKSRPRVAIYKKDKKKEVTQNLKSLILTKKLGLPITRIRDEYFDMVGEEIPITEIGYKSLYQLLGDIPEIVQQKRVGSIEPHLYVRNNRKTLHLQKLIEIQKDPKRKRRRYSKPSSSFSSDFSKKQRWDSFDTGRDSPNTFKYNTSYTNSSDSAKPTIRANVGASCITKESAKKIGYKANFDAEEAKKGTDRTSTFVSTEENLGEPTIFDVGDKVDSHQIVTKPIIGTNQIIGDDYSLQLCIRYTNYTYERKEKKKSAITVGTVQSGLSIRKAIKRLDNIRTMSNKILINVGTVDVYSRRSADEMIADYKELINLLESKYGYSTKQLTLCTLPPMCNVPKNDHVRCSALEGFNGWLRKFAKEGSYKLIDLNRAFLKGASQKNYDLFQDEPRMVSGTSHPHMLWNFHGRQTAMKLLCS